MSDIASLGIKVESNLKTLNKDMEKTISLSEKVTSATEKMKAQMAGVSSTTKNVITEEVKRQRSIDNLIKSLTLQEIRLKEGKSGLDNYKASLLGATDAEKKQIAALNTSIKSMQDANAAAKKHDSILGSLITRLSALGAAYFGLQAIKEFTKDVVLLSARYETLGVVVENVGKTAGYSTLEINEQSKALQKQGISMIQSRESITKLIQAHIDLSNAQKLGRIAQDAAVIGNVNSSHALERIVYGIQTAQIEVLKSVGLNVNFENSYKKLSIQLGKSTTDLTESEKTQARLNVVLERGADIAGTYESAMTTAGKQITSFTRYLEDFKVIFGQAFNAATAEIVSDLTIYMKEFTGTIGSSETQSGLKQFADGLGVILTTFISLGKAAIEVTKYIGEIGNLSKNLSIEQKGIELVNKGLIDQVKYTKATWEEKKKLIAEAEPITKITKKIGEQTEGYNLYSEAVKKSSEELRKAKKKEQDALDKALLDQKKAQSESERAAKKAESDEKARQGRVDAIINKMKEQIATYKQATEVSAEYQLKQEGASPAEIKLAKDLANTIDALKAKTKAQEAYKKVMDKTAPEPIEMNRQKSIEAVNQAVKDGAVLNGTYAESLAQINKHFDDLDLKDFKSGLKELETEINSMKTASFGNEMADGINNAVISMRDLNDYLGKQTHIQAELNKKKEEANKLSNDKERKKALKEIDDLEDKNITNQLSGYRQLFGTTSQLFKENSREREVMHNIEMAFAAAEIAMNLEKTISAAYLAIAESGTLPPPASFAAIAAMTALMAGIVAAAGGSLSGGGSASAPSVSASSTQGTGTVMGNPSEKSQSANNALEFMKDIEAKQYNELRDINKGVVDLNNNITNLVTNIVRTGAGTGDMGIKTGTSTSTSELQNISSKGFLAAANTMSLGTISASQAIASLTKNIPVLGNITAGVSDWINDTVSSFSSAVFGGTKKTSILAQGLEVSTAKIGDLLEGAGLDIQKFADIKIKKSGGLFGSDKTYLKTITQALEPDEESIKIMFTNVFKNVGETMVAISKELNLGDDKLKEIYAYTFDIGKIDLKGMDSEQINEAISSAINTASDEAVTALFGELIGKYVQIGEGLLETAVRVVSERAVVLDILEMTGQGFKDSDIPAYSLEVTQSLISIAGGLKELQDASTTYYDKFFSDNEKQIRLQGQLTESLKDMGEALPENREGFRKLVEAQKLNTISGQQNYVALLALSEGADKYYSVLEDGIKTAQEAAKAEEERIKAEQEALKEKQVAILKARASLEIDLLRAEGKTAEYTAATRKKELEAMDSSLWALQERIWALDDEAARTKEAAEIVKTGASDIKSALKEMADNTVDYYESVSTAAQKSLDDARGLLERSFEAEEQKIISEHEKLLSSLQTGLDAANQTADDLKSSIDSLVSARKSMVLANDESLQYFNVQSQLFKTLQESKAGNLSGLGSLSENISTLTGDTTGFFKSGEDYKRDFFKTYYAISELEGISTDQLSEQEKTIKKLQDQIDQAEIQHALTIEALKAQLDETLKVNKSIVSVNDAIVFFKKSQEEANIASQNLSIAQAERDLLNLQIQQDNSNKFNQMIVELLDISMYSQYTNESIKSLNKKIEEIISASSEESKDKDSSISGYANGGIASGTYLVGELGPEILTTPPSRITSNRDLNSVMSDEDVKRILKEIKEEIARGNFAIAKNTQDSAKTLKKFDYDGMPTTRTE